MNVRETSIEAYHEIQANGLLEGLMWLTYNVLYHHGPMTQMETCRTLNQPEIQDRSIMPRFAQLEDQGVIQTIGKKKCSITGNEVLLWDVTKNLPVKVKKEVQPKCSHCQGTGWEPEPLSGLPPLQDWMKEDL